MRGGREVLASCATSPASAHRVGEVEGHGVVLGVVAEALGDDGVAEEEGEVGEDVLAGGGDGARGGVTGSALLVGHGCVAVFGWGVGLTGGRRFG